MIRMARVGAKKKPSYRIVVIEKEKARDGRSVEVVGHYDPLSRPRKLHLEHDRIAHWIKSGAKPSDTVARLLKSQPAAPPVAEPAG